MVGRLGSAAETMFWREALGRYDGVGEDVEMWREIVYRGCEGIAYRGCEGRL